MIKNIIYILCVISIIWSSEMLINDKALLFCIDKTESVLDFSEDISNRSDTQIQLSNFFQSISEYDIQPWLNAASDDDYSGDIYLNRIYRVTFHDINRESLSHIKMELSSFSFLSSRFFLLSFSVLSSFLLLSFQNVFQLWF